MARTKKASKSSDKPARTVRTRGGSRPRRGDVVDPDAQLEVPGAERPRVKAIDKVAFDLLGLRAEKAEADAAFEERQKKFLERLEELMAEHGMEKYAIDGDWVVVVESRGKQVKVKRAAKPKKVRKKEEGDEE